MDLASVLSYLLVLLACVIAFTIAVGTATAQPDRAFMGYRLSLAFMAVGAALTMLRMAIPMFLTSFLANLLILVGMALYVDFLSGGKRLWRALIAVAFPISMASLTYFIYYTDCYSGRGVSVHPYHMMITLLSGLAIMRPGWQDRSQTLRQGICAAMFFLTAVLFSLRVWILWQESACADTLLTSPLHAVSILSFSVAVLSTHFMIVRGLVLVARSRA
ncbi:hypothetical protein ACFSM5_21720 [Lacibacterium aquatile]|uniref:Uncharacterized protein n=1 Tax=Lacibacterium aquatile TaxID=1168082 RepID=A0ABW5E1N5_9PROT